MFIQRNEIAVLPYAFVNGKDTLLGPYPWDHMARLKNSHPHLVEWSLFWLQGGVDVPWWRLDLWVSRSEYQIVLFHAWEWLPIIWWLGHRWRKERWAFAVIVGMASHFFVDQFTWAKAPWVGFITYRALHGFRTEALVFSMLGN